MKALIVRFKGHVCAGVMTGLSKHPLLLRKKKNEDPFVFHFDDRGDRTYNETTKATRLAAARAIKFTQEVRWKLATKKYEILLGTQSGVRLMRDAKMTRRGKRWKICEITLGESPINQTHESTK